MRSLFGLLLLASSALAYGALASACGASSNNASPNGGDPPAGTTTPVAPDGVSGALPCNVDAVLAKNCRSCHDATPKYGAPMPLVTAADLHAPAKSNPARHVYELVPERINDDAKPMPQPPNPRLSAADRATLASWANSGAPAGTVKCGTTTPDAGPMTACKPDLPIAPASDYEMPAGTGDEYVCYGIEVTRPTPTHVVGFSPRIDNTSIVHHVVLFQSDTAVSTTPTPCSAGGSLQWRMVTGWAPGGKGFELPPEAGFPVATTGVDAEATHYVMQIHYSNPQALTGQKDHSGFDLCTTAPRANEADVIAFGTQKITLPPGSKTEANCYVDITAQLAPFAGVHLIASMPHMHKLGTDMWTKRFAGSPTGAATDLGSVSNWSFATQAWLPIGGADGKGSVVAVGDRIETHCAWNNTTGAEVKYGQNTADEMCYSFTTYYPKIKLPPPYDKYWSWSIPATASTCQ